MKVIFIHCLCLLYGFCLSLPLAASQTDSVWTIDNLPMVHLQDARRYVVNPDHILTTQTVDSIDAMLYQLERQRGVQSIVAVVNRIAPDDCYEFALQLGQKYGVGNKKQSSGFVMVISAQGRCYQVVTGHGLEGTLPDALIYKIQQRYLVPHLKKGEWDRATLQTVRAMSAVIQGDTSLLKSDNKEDGAKFWGLLIALFIAGFVLYAAFRGAANKAHLCPNCKKAKLTPTHRQIVKLPNGKRVNRTTYQCSNCNYVEVRDEDEDDGNHFNASMLLPLLLLGGRGRGGDGGGFGGGSFGGGSFGGGGAGGRF